MSVKVCVEFAEQEVEECSEYEDQGKSKCSDWDKNCCDWWPCSSVCEVFTWVCRGWYWVAKWVCVGWTWVTALVCVAWQVIEILLIPFAYALSELFSIPIIGRILREIWDTFLEIWWRFVGLLDAFLELLGLRLSKKLRVCIVILSDKGGPLASEASLEAAIDSAAAIYEAEANVSLIVTGIHVVSDSAPDRNLDLECGASAWADDLLLAGSYFEAKATASCCRSCTSRAVGYGAVISAFVVRRIAGTTAGCSLGPLSDYVVVEGRAGKCLAHELAHACGLPHLNEAGNLANPTCGGTQLHQWQSIIVRNSRHVTYV